LGGAEVTHDGRVDQQVERFGREHPERRDSEPEHLARAAR
jgi:hypothetical protein